MNVRPIAFAAVALIATSTVLAEAAKQPAEEARPAVREQTLAENVAAGMREILRAVTPEISLPKIEIRLPSLDAVAR